MFLDSTLLESLAKNGRIDKYGSLGLIRRDAESIIAQSGLACSSAYYRDWMMYGHFLPAFIPSRLIEELDSSSRVSNTFDTAA